MKMTGFRIRLALLCVALMLTAVAALARTVEPERKQSPDETGGKTLPATLKTYDEELQCFPSILYERDRYSEEDIAGLQAGDKLVVCGQIHTVREIGQSSDGILEFELEDGEEILMDAQQDGSYIAYMAEDDVICMHVIGEKNLKAAENIVLIDYSDLDAEDPVTLEGLDAVLALQVQREEAGIGLDGTFTNIVINEADEITEIRIFYAPWQ